MSFSCIYYESKKSVVEANIKFLIKGIESKRLDVKDNPINGKTLSLPIHAEQVRIFEDNLKASLLLLSNVTIRISRSRLLAYFTSRVDLKRANKVIEELVDILVWESNEIKRLNCLKVRVSSQSTCVDCCVSSPRTTRAVMLSKFKVV